MLSNDTSILPPPTTGLFPYNTFYPTLGVPYLDPVFGAVNTEGSSILRITDIVGDKVNNWTEGIYAHHWANADGTYAFWTTGPPRTRTVIKISDQSTVRSGVSWPPSAMGGDISWHPTLPNIYFYPDGTDLRRYDVSTGGDTRVNSAGKFPFALEQNGGFLDLVDATGTKFVVQYNSEGHVYDSTTDTVYSGAVGPPAGGAGVWGITSNGAYAIFLATDAALAHESGKNAVFRAYPLDHVNHVVGTYFNFWNDVSGSHCCFSCPSDGNTYMLRAENTSNGYYYRVKVKDQGTNSHATMIADSDNVQLFTNGWTMSTHYTGGIIGALRDWTFLDTELDPSSFDGGLPTWFAYHNELIAVNLITFEVRRLAHHRSRGFLRASPYGYAYQPKVSCSWDGSAIVFLSNYNYQGDDAPDMFAIQNPLGGVTGNFFPLIFK